MKAHTILIQELNQLIEDTHFQHWNTTSYAQHMALDATYSSLSDLQDKIAELLISYYGSLESFKLLPIPSCTVEELPTCIHEFAEKLRMISQKDKLHDLNNISDEVTQVGSKLKYLLRLK